MISASNKFKEAISQNRNFYVTADCTLADGTSLKINKGDVYISGNGIVDSSDSSDFPLGCAIEKTATLALVNDDDRFSEYNFNGARFVLFLNLEFTDGTIETIRRGTFVVIKKPATAGKISMTMVDRMHYADKTYTTNLIFPTNAGEVLRDACQTCGILLGDASFPNDDYVVNEAPVNTTFRAVIGNIAMLSGGNARIDESDRLRIIQFNSGIFKKINYDGGVFRPWTEGDNLDGGTFNPWTEGDSVDGGTFRDFGEYHLLYRQTGLQVDTDDVVVTGVKTTVDQVDYNYGNDGYVINVKNDLLNGNIEDGIQRIGSLVVGLRMRPFSCNHIAYPLATFLDPVYVVDFKDNVYESYLTNVEFLFNGYTKLSNNAKSAEEQAKEYYSGNSALVEQAKKDAEKMLDAYDIAYRNMNELAANSLGYFSTTVTQDDGSQITYLHDKPELAESKTVYKRGIDGFFVTQDYQGTDEATTLAGKWTAGFDSNGDAVLNILYAIGIEAEWINTRGLTARDNNGNITLRVDPATGQITLSSQSMVDGETLGSRFNVVSGAITAEVTRAKDAEEALSSRLELTESSISAKVSRTDVEGMLDVFAGNVKLSVTNGKLGSNASITLSVDGETSSGSLNLSNVRSAFRDDTSSITISGGTVTFNSNTFVVNSTYFKVTSTGVITASSGTIGGMTLTGSSIYSGTNSISSTTAGVYMGTNGFRNYYSASKNTTITNGTLTSYGGEFHNVSIRDGSIVLSESASGMIEGRGVVSITNEEIALKAYAGSGSNFVRIFSPDDAHGRVRAFERADSTAQYSSLDGQDIKYTGTCSQASDRRIKKDITELDSKHSALFDNLIPRIYRLKDGDGQIHAGFVSQEVQEAMSFAGIAPEELALVDNDEENDLLMLNYIELIPIIVKELQVLKKAVKEEICI